MKRMTILATAVLCTLFVAITLSRPTLAFAQEEKPEPKQQEPEAKPEHPQPQETPRAEKNQEKPEKAEKNDQDKDKNNARQDKSNSQPAQAEPGSNREPAGQRAAQSQPAGKGGHIPDDKFRASFGHSHAFKVSRPLVVNNQTTIQYSGYSFILSDPWPTGWAYTDDCYIDYVDGDYFLFDLLHPGVRIALIVMM